MIITRWISAKLSSAWSRGPERAIVISLIHKDWIYFELTGTIYFIFCPYNFCLSFPIILRQLTHCRIISHRMRWHAITANDYIGSKTTITIKFIIIVLYFVVLWYLINIIQGWLLKNSTTIVAILRRKLILINKAFIWSVLWELMQVLLFRFVDARSSVLFHTFLD